MKCINKINRIMEIYHKIRYTKYLLTKNIPLCIVSIELIKSIVK